MKRIIASAFVAASLSLPATAEVTITPIDDSMVKLVKEGWQVVSEAGGGIFMLSNGEEVALCFLDFRGGHAKVLRGEETDPKFKTINAGCASLSE